MSVSYVGSCGFKIGPETDSFSSCLWIVQFKEGVTWKT